MAILNPFGIVCMTSEPIRTSNFYANFSSPYGEWADTDSLEMARVTTLGMSIKVQTWQAYNSEIPMPGFKAAIQDIQLVFRCFDNTTGFKFWSKWIGMAEGGKGIYSQDKDTVETNRGAYLGSGEITLTLPTGATWKTISIVGMWPSMVRIDSLDVANDGDPVSYSVVACADHVIIS